MSLPAHPPAEHHQIRAIAGVDAGMKLLLGQRIVIVGRSSVANADFRINDPLSPPYRFDIRWSAELGRYLLNVLSHPNPVFLNDQRCADGTVELADGDVIRIGRTEIVFERTNVYSSNPV